ncbi:RING-H2 finger A2A [Perilla frutescens var. hirtella]|uniref:RING-H2 finger A2A n=1 Tax=Perilla frutescens var. hirtella TaxID=608512 RepID=A0AAD4JB68_PERFH|nr:RING-H2 finger A2A [Perilla frutescens var. hirtella]KAH6830579.1 RING-H2 finger A2A [Perilla frutescens var. hirtella]
MASLSQIFSHIYSMTMLLFSILLLELAILVRGAARATVRRSITTEQFLKIVDQKAPARRYEGGGLGFEPLECSVCLSLYEEGDEVRKLKCKHTFHKGCVDTWLQQDYATCPLCRRAVLPIDVVVKHQNHRLQEYHDGGDEELMLMLYALHGNFVRRLF